MKKINFSILYIGVLCLLVSYITIGCKKPTDGVSLTLNTDIAPVVYSFKVFDANPNNNITESEFFTVKVTGKDADKIYTVDGTRNFKFVKGYLSVMLKPGTVPTKLKPIQFSITIKYKNYLKTVIPVYLTQKDKSIVQVPLVNLNNPPKGVSVENKIITTNSSGKLDNDIKIQTPIDANKKEQVIVTIPKNTGFFDSKGNPLSGDISVQLVHFDNSNSGSLSSFPGGFSASNVMNSSNQSMGGGTFQTAGFIAMEMNSTNGEVSSFSQPIDISMSVNSNLKDPTTNQNIQTGDQIPVWSFDPETGNWKEHGNSTLRYDNSSNQYFADFSTLYRNWYNYDYFFRSCGYESSIRLNYSGTETFCKYFIEFENPRFSYYTYYPSYYTELYNNKIITLNPGLPAGENIRIRFINPYTDEEIGVTPYFTSCYGQYDFGINAPTSENILEFSVYGKCPNTNRIYRPSGFIYYQISGSNDWQPLGFMSNGFLKTPALRTGQTYNLGTENGGQWYTTEVTIEENMASAEVEWLLPEDYSGCK